MESKFTGNADLFKSAMRERVAAALEAIGLTAERHAKENCPVDTGLLRNSITHAISGKAPAITNYRASYGSNTHMVKNANTGLMEKKRYSANSKNAGTVGSGHYTGTAPTDPPDRQAVYIGTNVEYAKKQETGDSLHHTVGKAHFLRDAVANHADEFKRVAEKQLRKS